MLDTPAGRRLLFFLLLRLGDGLGEGRLHCLGYAGEFVVRPLGKAHQLHRPVRQLHGQDAVADEVPGLNLLYALEVYCIDIGTALAVGVQHQDPLVSQNQPRIAEAPVRRDVGRQQYHQQLAGVQLCAQVLLYIFWYRLYQIHTHCPDTRAHSNTKGV